LEKQHNIIIRELEKDVAFAWKYNSHWLAIKLLENDSDGIQKVKTEHKNADAILNTATECRYWIQKTFAEEPETVVAEQRYAYIHGACREAVHQDKASERIDYTEMIDKIVLHRFLGVGIFFIVMFLIYQLTFVLGNPISDIIDGSFAWLQNFIISRTPSGILRDFLVDGIIGGVGGVLVFFPIVLLLFLGLSLLEDTGYMARAAFVMDKFMHIFGLHGRSFIPLMVSTGCAVPGIMSARTLVNPKDRILTILVAPLMMCSAKVPVIAMLAASFFPENAGKVFWGIWLFSWMLALLIASLFRNIFFKGERSPFVMELPPYRMPTLRGIFTHVWEKSWSYVRKAGTFILAASVIIWFLLYFPRINPGQTVAENDHSAKITTEASGWNSIVRGTPSVTENDTTSSQAAVIEQMQTEGNQLAQQQMVNSFGGRIGRFMEPIFRPCGFDWRLDVSLFAGFAAKEVIISSMGIVYGIGEADVDIGSAKNPLKTRLKNDPKYNRLNMLAFMLFVLIYLPCMATMATVKKELGKWRYPIFLAVYTVVLAWLVATGVYQIGTLLGVG
ncbi:ferrous iron transport protein B, partial [bacterium]|nr:ferrous iron transport protein B [bacterium]